jgi:hypothetical protein
MAMGISSIQSFGIFVMCLPSADGISLLSPQVCSRKNKKVLWTIEGIPSLDLRTPQSSCRTSESICQSIQRCLTNIYLPSVN